MVVLVSFFRFWTVCIILDSVYYYSRPRVMLLVS